MPQERKKRGRREEAKRKLEDDQITVQWGPTGADDQTPENGEAGIEHVDQGAYFGLLDEQELEYFATLDALITSDDFGGDDERAVFIDNTFAEIQGRELKIATSPSSKFLEKLIFNLRRDQLSSLAGALVPQFPDLIHRPSASFCCEALILRLGQESMSGETSGESSINLLNDIGGQMTSDVMEILSHAVASHVLRIYLLILTGSTLSYDAKISFLQKKQKDDDFVHQRTTAILKDVSNSTLSLFQESLQGLISALSSHLDTSTLQSLALSPIASPVLQILVEYELATQKKMDHQPSASVMSLLLPNEDIEGENSAFMQTLLRDTAGSHLMEILVAKSPGRIFKKLHRSLFDGKLLTIARSKTAITYVLVKALDRFSSGNLEKAMHEISPGLRNLVQDANTSILTALIENSRRRQVNLKPLVVAFSETYGTSIVKQNSPAFSDSDDQDIPVHVSIMLQTMLAAQDGLQKIVLDGLTDLSQDEVIHMSKQRAASRIIQAAMTKDRPSYFRKQIVSSFLGTITDLGQHNVASHVVDALWTGSTGLKFLRDRLINEVLANEHTLRQTIAGRAVCRNWRKWSREAEMEDRPMTALDKARKRHAIRDSDKRKKARLN